MSIAPRFLCLLLLVLGRSPVAAQDATVYQIVRPTDDAHNLLPKTCRVCHKDEELRFFIVAAPTQEALERAVDMLAGRPAVAGATTLDRPTNPHASVQCLFCHLEQPDSAPPPSPMTFRTLDGTPAEASDVPRHCQLCHPEGSYEHRRVVRGDDAAAALAEAELPTLDGKVSCTTCHEVHAQESGPLAVKKAYKEFAAKSSESYPHGNRAACEACHPVAPKPGGPAAFREANATERCIRCHDPGHGGNHPMGVTSTEQTYPFDFLDYPREKDGRLHCSTCHDEPCEAGVDTHNPNFLRGGPYPVLTEFCYRCHPKAGTGSLSPHKQVNEKGMVLSTTCAICHRDIPNPDAPPGTHGGPGDLLYTYSPVELCVGCHEPGPHPSGINHMVELSENRRAQVVEYEERHAVFLPLHRGTVVVCTTCHNPHDKGVLKGVAALGAGEHNFYRVPSYAELCTPCHARYD